MYLFTKGTEQYRIYNMQNNHKCKILEEKEVLRFAWSDELSSMAYRWCYNNIREGRV
jgi:hypothetical protein